MSERGIGVGLYGSTVTIGMTAPCESINRGETNMTGPAINTPTRISRQNTRRMNLQGFDMIVSNNS